jgi:arylsulfatase A-like enzyme
MKRYLRLKTFLSLAGICGILFTAGCVRKQPAPEIFRILDQLEAGGVITDGNVSFPERSVPLADLGSGENPGELKRKLKIGGRELDVLMASPGSEYGFSPGFEEPSRMDFGIGIVRYKDAFSSSDASSGVTFRVILERKELRKTVFEKYLDIAQEDNHVFSLEKIEVPYDLRATRLILSTEGEENAFSFWFNPVLYQPKDSSRKVILISIDTLRADHLHCYGYGRQTSPHIDALAVEGALFESVLAPAPWTLPSHVSLLTSLYGAHHQVYREDQRMDPGITTLAELLRTRGYLCSAFTGGGFLSSIYGFSKGFSSYQEGEGGVFHQDSAGRVYASVSEWLERNWNRDFFLFIHTYQPHSPYACPPPYKVMFLEEDAQFGHVDLLGHLGGKSEIFRPLPEPERKNIIALYDGEIRYTDECLIGPLIEKLKQLEIYEDALVIFTSDHGEEFYDHGGWGHGQSMYNESLRVPLIIKFPDSRHKGRRIPEWVSLVDIMPTILEEAGIDYADENLDGISLTGYLENGGSFSRRLLADVGEDVLGFHLPRKIAAVQDRDKVIFRERMKKQDLSFFTVPPPYSNVVEMYRLPDDPGERLNLADTYPGLVNSLISQVNAVYRNAAKRRTEKAEVDERVKEQLKALGYIR